MIAAAAIASSVNAMRLASPTTNLAQNTSYTECHGTYAYQCIEQKVNDTLGHMTGEVQTHKDDCIVTANDLREEIVEAIQDLRKNLEDGLEDLRETQEAALNAKLDSATDKIEGAAETAVQNLCDEAEGRVNGTSAAALERKVVEGEIKKIYYEDAGPHSANDQKDAIKKLVEDFQEFVSMEGTSYQAYADKEVAAVEDVISTEVTCFTDDVDAARAAWNTAAADGTTELNDRIAERIAAMDTIIAGKQAAMDDIVAKLTEDFIVVFWDTVEEIYHTVNYYERQGLIWKALYQKGQFLEGVNEIRAFLVAGLAETRSALVNELNAERTAFAATVGAERTAYSEVRAAMRSELAGVVSAARQSVDATVNAKTAFLADKGADDPAGVLEQFVYDLAAIQFNPNASGAAHGNGYQPYAKWVANNLGDQISVFGVDIAATFESVTSGAVDALNAALAGEKASIAADQTNADNTLDAVTAGLIATLIDTREAMEAVLGEKQTAQEEADYEARHADQAALVTTKNNCWKDLSWIVRATLAGVGGSAGHEHGLSAGPVFGNIA